MKKLLRWFKPGWCIIHAGQREPCFICNNV
jgi:hypothetical protein